MFELVPIKISTRLEVETAIQVAHTFWNLDLVKTIGAELVGDAYRNLDLVKTIGAELVGDVYRNLAQTRNMGTAFVLYSGSSYTFRNLDSLITIRAALFGVLECI